MTCFVRNEAEEGAFSVIEDDVFYRYLKNLRETCSNRKKMLSIIAHWFFGCCLQKKKTVI